MRMKHKVNDLCYFNERSITPCFPGDPVCPDKAFMHMCYIVIAFVERNNNNKKRGKQADHVDREKWMMRCGETAMCRGSLERPKKTSMPFLTLLLCPTTKKRPRSLSLQLSSLTSHFTWQRSCRFGAEENSIYTQQLIPLSSTTCIDPIQLSPKNPLELFSSCTHTPRLLTHSLIYVNLPRKVHIHFLIVGNNNPFLLFLIISTTCLKN